MTLVYEIWYDDIFLNISSRLCQIEKKEFSQEFNTSEPVRLYCT
jgi:hypothetical protein